MFLLDTALNMASINELFAVPFESGPKVFSLFFALCIIAVIVENSLSNSMLSQNRVKTRRVVAMFHQGKLDVSFNGTSGVARLASSK